MLPKAVVVCVLLALLSAGSQGNKEANEDNHHRAVQKERFLRFVGQPAVFPKDSKTACLPDSYEYYRRLGLLQCDGKYIQAVFNEIETSNCTNEYYNDTLFFSGCGTNDNGDVCAGINDSKYEDFYDRCYRWFDTSDCSSECQTMLRQLSDSVGCCIHDDYNLRMPSVWMNCDIQQPEVCADTPNIADVLAKKSNVGPCTDKCTERQLYYVFCKNLDEEYEKLDRECGMENRICGFHNGEFCATMDFPDSYFDTIFDECVNKSDDECSTNCKNVLGEFVDRVGCCFEYVNSSYLYYYIDYLGLPSDLLLSACGIEVPDACNSFNSKAVPDDFLECAGRTINTSEAAGALQSGVYSIGLIIIGLIGTYI